MAITWEKLAGDTSKFAIKIAFVDDPDPGTGATREESLSWGSFEIWINERNLCQSQFGGEITNSAHWYLLPMLEWWATNWDPLFHEERLPNQNADYHAQASLQKTREAPLDRSADAALAWEQGWHDWWARHCIEASRAGGVFPSICFRRWREKVEVSWDGASAPACPPGVRFVQGAGSARVPSMDVAGPLYSVLADAASHLLSRCPESERLASLRAGIDALRSPREDRLAWLLGLGRTLSELRESWAAFRRAVADLPARARDAIFGTPDQSGLVVEPFPAALMFGSVSPRLSSNDRFQLLRHLAEAHGGTAERLDELASDEPVESENAWSQGYELAQRLLDDLGVPGENDDRVNLAAILSSFGVATEDIHLEDDSIRGVAIGGTNYRPTILLNQAHRTNTYPTGRRFSQAHELCHLLYDRAFAREVALPSGPWAPRDVEERANAFAAMLLMPRELVRRAMASSSSDPGSRELVLDVANRLGTSFSATLHHMHNLGLLSEEERDALIEEAMDQSGRRQP